jgi:hypothetical protein
VLRAPWVLHQNIRSRLFGVKEYAPVTADEQLDFDRDGCNLSSANRVAASVIRQLAAQLESAGYKASSVRATGADPAERARTIDFALVNLASVMSEMEVIGLVNALRYAANATQESHVCEFCGCPTEPWSMLLGDAREDEDLGPLVLHSWDQYGYTLCRTCHLAVRQARWQTAAQM